MRAGFQVLDCDLHVIEPDAVWTEYLDPALRERGPQPPAPDGSSWLSMQGRALPAFADTPERARAIQLRYSRSGFRDRLAERDEDDIFDLAHGTRASTMLRAMDREGIDVAVCFRTYAAHALAFDDLDAPLAAGVCRAFNRWLADVCSEDPSRLKLAAQIPVHDVESAVAEAIHAVEVLGAVTLVLPSHPVRERPAYHVDYEPLWATAADLGVPVSFHGIQSSYTAGTLSSRYHDNHVLGHATGHPLELMLSLGAVLTGGVAARHPSLRFAFLEGNCGWLPWWLHALDARWAEYGDRERFGQDALPSELFREQCFVSADVDEPELPHVVEVLGADNLVLSTDWPHDDSSYPHALEEFLALPLSDDARRRILWDSCARLYHI
jgi:predicted TIM-barrel fold metal-dependent hydrolase